MVMPAPCACRYAKSDRLRNLVNLVVVGGVIDPEDTGDREERAECQKMHTLIKQCDLKVSHLEYGMIHADGSAAPYSLAISCRAGR